MTLLSNILDDNLLGKMSKDELVQAIIELRTKVSQRDLIREIAGDENNPIPVSELKDRLKAIGVTLKHDSQIYDLKSKGEIFLTESESKGERKEMAFQMFEENEERPDDQKWTNAKIAEAVGTHPSYVVTLKREWKMIQELKAAQS